VRDKIKALSWQTVIYGTGHILSRLVTFLLLPLYTNIFDAAEYGVISLAYTFMGFMGVILHYGLDAALLKRYVQADQAERPRYLTTAYCSFLITSLLSALSITALSIPLAPVLLGGSLRPLPGAHRRDFTLRHSVVHPPTSAPRRTETAGVHYLQLGERPRAP